MTDLKSVLQSLETELAAADAACEIADAKISALLGVGVPYEKADVMVGYGDAEAAWERILDQRWDAEEAFLQVAPRADQLRILQRRHGIGLDVSGDAAALGFDAIE